MHDTRVSVTAKRLEDWAAKVETAQDLEKVVKELRAAADYMRMRSHIMQRNARRRGWIK